MINILLPSMGTSTFFKDAYFPKPLIEIKGTTMLELIIDNYKCLNPSNYVFVFASDDCLKFHLDSSAKILSPSSQVVKLSKQTAGALCSCLMASEYINNNNSLIIANSDQIIDVDYTKVLSHFDKLHDDAGVITFPNIHPRWSYARIVDDEVVEIAEKRPISKNAIAGFYYFKKGTDFVQAAKSAIIKQNHLDGKYYISASLNEMILLGKKIGFYNISKEQYKSFYSPDKIKAYEDSIK